MSRKIKWLIAVPLSVLGFAGIPTLWLLLEQEPTQQMGIIFISILGIYPLFSLILGFFAASDVKGLWPAPFLIPLIFLPYSHWLLRGFVPEMLIYLGIYLVASFAAMGVGHTLHKIKKKKAEEQAFMERKCRKVK